MRFELWVALKYLIPRRKHLSASIIAAMSIVVVSLVVWLTVVFFSVSNGIEKNWIDKLVSFAGPVRMTPTRAYFDSYYYRVDGASAASGYRYKTLHEKLIAAKTDPYNAAVDAELPADFVAERNAKGELQDLVKLAHQAATSLKGIPGLHVTDYEMTFANVRLRLVRPHQQTQTFLNQLSTLGSYAKEETTVIKTMLPLSAADADNLLRLLALSSENVSEEHPERDLIVAYELLQKRLQRFFQQVRVTHVTLPSGEVVAAELIPASVTQAHDSEELRFQTPHGVYAFRDVALAQIISEARLWEGDRAYGEAVLVPKQFRDQNVLIGDRGTIAYSAPGASSLQEQRIPIYVAGFYDPGLLPLGGKLIFVDRQITSLIRETATMQDPTFGTGFILWMDDWKQAVTVKERLLEQLSAQGLQKYWKIETFHEYDFAKDMIQQLQSDKTLFSLIAIIILLVACSNIISMLLLLVNDKRTEIGILQSMGASRGSIATIFGLCGILTGLISGLVGTLTALFTLRHLDSVVKFLSFLQGHQAFNTLFFGERLPNSLSLEALGFVIALTALLSLVAGIIPAIKATRLRPAAILRAE